MEYLHHPNNYTASAVLRSLNDSSDFDGAIDFYVSTCDEASKDIFVMDQYSIALFHTGRYREAAELCTLIFKRFPVIEYTLHTHLAKNMRYNLSKLLSPAADDIPYNSDVVSFLMNSSRGGKLPVMFSVTTCKRLRLFVKTMNSFLNCCEDIHTISRFVCVDDQSSDDDVTVMSELYPFMEIIRKPFENKGHAPSMNVITEVARDYEYLFHIEDDWEFLARRPYVADCISVLRENKMYGQCVLNNNYAESINGPDILDGEYKVSMSGVQYFKHIQDSNFDNNRINVRYWPHFSMNPSIMRTSMLESIGDFEKKPHFEFDYGVRYMNSGYQTAFLNNIHVSHIGRPNSQRNDSTTKNAYDLNDEKQF